MKSEFSGCSCRSASVSRRTSKPRQKVETKVRKSYRDRARSADTPLLCAHGCVKDAQCLRTRSELHLSDGGSALSQDEHKPDEQSTDASAHSAEDALQDAADKANEVGDGVADPSTPVDEAIESQTSDALKAAQDAVASIDGAEDGDAISQIAAEVAQQANADGDTFTPPTVTSNGSAGAPGDVDLLADVNLHVKIELGRTRMYVEDVLKLNEGAVVELDKAAGDPVDIYVNDRYVARGEVLVINDCFCVRVSEIVQAPTAD